MTRIFGQYESFERQDSARTNFIFFCCTVAQFVLCTFSTQKGALLRMHFDLCSWKQWKQKSSLKVIVLYLAAGLANSLRNKLHPLLGNVNFMGRLKMQDLDNAGPGKWRTKSQGWKMQELENDGPNRRAGKCMQDLENVWVARCLTL